MAAAQRAEVNHISVPGTEWIDRGYALDDFIAGDLVIISATPHLSREFDMNIEAATGTVANGVVLKDCKAGGQVEFAKIAELSGFIGLTPGASLTVVDGQIDTTPLATDTGFANIRARNTESVYVMFN